MGDLIVSHYNYWVVIVLMMMGLYVVFASGNMVKRLVGLGVFQTSVFLFYITLGKVAGGIPPILPEHEGGEDHAPAGAAGVAATEGHDEAVSEDVHEGAETAGGQDGHDAAAAHGADAAHAVGADHAGAGHHDAPIGFEFDASALDAVYSNPLPHVLILTAIVVGVATLAVGLALVVGVRDAYGSIEDSDISRAEYDLDANGGNA